MKGGVMSKDESKNEKPVVNLPEDFVPIDVPRQPRFDDFFGMFKTVTSAPSGIPKTPQDQIVVYFSSPSTWKLYVYDTLNNAWKSVTIT